MNYPCILTALAGVLLASSCDKLKSLSKEQTRLEAELQQGSGELQSLESQYASLNTQVGGSMPPEQQHAGWEKKNADLKQTLAELSKKCTQGDELLKKAHAKLDAYKALNAQ